MIWQAIGSGATALGVIFIGWQIWQTRRQNRTSFEDTLAREYRGLARTISIKALLGKELTDDEFLQAKTGLWHYIDLSNEEVFLRKQKRISDKIWHYWCEGIQFNLSLPAFKRAWEEFKAATPHIFTELRQLEDTKFKKDPADW